MFFWKGTPLFPTIMVEDQEELGEDIAITTETHPTPIITQPSSSQPSRKQKLRKIKRRDTELPQTSVPTETVTDEAVNKEMYDSLERATTTATSLDAEQDRGNISKTQSKATPNEPSSPGTSSGGGPRHQDTMGDTIAQTGSENVFKFSNDPLLARFNTPQSGEDRIQLKELMELYTNLQQRVFDMETTKTSKAQEITTLVEIKTSKPKAKGIVMQEPSEATTTTIIPLIKSQDNGKGIMVELEMPLKKKGQTSLDEEFAFKLQAEEDEQERIIREKAQQIEEIEEVNLAWDDVQDKMKADYEMAQRLQAKEPEQLTDAEKARLFIEFLEKRRNGGEYKESQAEIAQESSSKRAGDELEQEIAKKQRIEDENESVELKRCLEIVPDDGDDVTIDATSLSSMLVQIGLQAQVRVVRTDKGTEFLNQTLHAYFAAEGILHQMSVARTPEQNGIVERRNRTLVEAARTMLSAAKVPLFFWAEAIATGCFTQNRSLVIPHHEKTPYHIINDQKPSVKFFYISCSICYIVRDGENLDKIKEKGDECIFVGYSTQSRAYKVFNKRTRVIMESIHVNFDELPHKASDQISSDPTPECQSMALEHNSLSPAIQRQANVPQADRIVTTSNELDLLFSLMFDELLNGSSKVVSKSSAVCSANAHN
nr:hypothetical protein [Tanacetum cinerariifolium]